MLHLHGRKIKKYGLTLALLICCANIFSMAQSYFNLPDHDGKPYYFGITLGTNVARFQIEQHTRFLLYDTVQVAEPVSSVGFALGLSATARLTHRLEARFNPQLMFAEKNIFYQLKYPDPIDGTSITKKVESVIFSFPFQTKFNSDRIGNFRVYMLGGVKADIDLAANARARRAEYLIKLEKIDYGVELGLGFNFYFQSFIFSPEIKISNGLKNIHSRDESLKYSNIIDRIQSRMIVFSIHLEG